MGKEGELYNEYNLLCFGKSIAHLVKDDGVNRFGDAYNLERM